MRKSYSPRGEGSNLWWLLRAQWWCYWHQLQTDWNLQSWCTSAHVGAHSGSHHGRPTMLATQSFGEIFCFFSHVFWGVLFGGGGFACLPFLFMCPRMSGQIGEIREKFGKMCNTWAPRPRDIAYTFSIPWRMALPFTLETYSNFSNPNFTCHFQTHLPVKEKLPKTCERNKHFMMAKGPKNLQENTCRERHSPTRPWVSQTGRGSREKKPPESPNRASLCNKSSQSTGILPLGLLNENKTLFKQRSDYTNTKRYLNTSYA